METRKRPEAVEVPVNKNYQHDLSHRHTTTIDFFRLQPVLCQEVIPGGKYSIDLRAIIQSAPLSTQIFGGCHLDLHAFFVPNRIVYEDWNAYYAGDRANQFSTTNPYHLPHVRTTDIAPHFIGLPDDDEATQNIKKERRRIFSSLGAPVHFPNTSPYEFNFSALQARAYQKIWWDYYRDSVNISESSKLTYCPVNGGNVTSQITYTFAPRYRTFKKDFITTLLQNPQLGSETFAKVNHLTKSVDYTGHTWPMYLGESSRFIVNSDEQSYSSGTAEAILSIAPHALRGAMAMQRFLERLGITGTRPMERLLSILGVKPSPERLQMAEFLGGKTIKVNIDGLVNSGSNEQISTDATEGQMNAWGIHNSAGSFGDHFGQGYQSGYAVGSGQSDKINYTSTEHGHILVIASLIPEYANPNGLQRQFIRGLATPDSDRFDFFTPDMDGVGYQEMLLNEVHSISDSDDLFAHGSDWIRYGNPYNVVGYQPKYEDYRYCADRLSGDFLEVQSALALRNMVFSLQFSEVFHPDDVQAGLPLTTSNFGFRSLFDKHFQISSDKVDHFVLSMYNVVDCSLPVTSNQLPTELSDLANSEMLSVANGGVRI